MRISDWSSDVCSSDLERLPLLDARSVSMSPDMPCPSERKYRASFKEVPEIFSDVSLDQPIVKNLDCTALQRLWTTYVPITVRDFSRPVNKTSDPGVLFLMIMDVRHQRHLKTHRRAHV